MSARGAAMLLALAVLALLAAAPFYAASFTITLLNYIGIYALVALGVVLLTGFGGLTSFGQAAFVGIAAYATAWLTTAEGASPWLGLLFGLALTGLVAALLGAVTLRLGGHYLPLGTVAWGLAIFFLFGNFEALGRHNGIADVPPIFIGSTVARTDCGDLLPDLGRADRRHDPRRQSAGIARGPRHPQPARRRGDGREPRHQRVSHPAHHFRHCGACSPAFGLALRPYEPLRQPDAVRSAHGHPISVHGDPRRIGPYPRRRGRRGADHALAKCPAGPAAASSRATASSWK